MASYQRRPRTPDELKSREASVRASFAAEQGALRLLTTPEGNPVYAAASKELARLRAALAALTPAEKAAQACHLPDSRIMGPHPAPMGTPNCLPMVGVNANWYDPKLPRSVWQMLTIERYWLSKKAVESGIDRSPRNIQHHLNKEVVESIDWKAVAEKLAQLAQPESGISASGVVVEPESEPGSEGHPVRGCEAAGGAGSDAREWIRGPRRRLAFFASLSASPSPPSSRLDREGFRKSYVI